jgi:PTH1 family peptidyl-tRNA hydrolase
VRLRRRGAGGSTAPADWLVVGLGNPGRRYEGTRHNVGFEVARTLARRWDLGRSATRYQGELSEGRAGLGGPRVALLLPQTYMNEAGRSASPARGAYKVELARVLVLHDEIDLPFGQVRTRVGVGGSPVDQAGHNGLKSLRAHLGDPGFARVRIGVGRPDSTAPEIVAGYVLRTFDEPREEVAALIESAADAAEGMVAAEGG